MYNVDDGMELPYSILPHQNINLRYGKTLQKESPVILEEQAENEKTPKKSNIDKSQSERENISTSYTSLSRKVGQGKNFNPPT